MSKALDIAIVGVSCVDCIATASGRRWNVQNPVSDVRISAGGLGNALVALSGLGLDVGISTRIGADMYGDFLMSQWRELGVDTSEVCVDADSSTGFAFVVNQGEERTPFYSAGANALLTLADVSPRLYENAGCMVIFFAGSLPSLDGAPMLELVKRCHAAGTPVILDVSDGIEADYGPIRSYLPYVNLVVNSEEGRRITGTDSPREMLRVLAEMVVPADTFLAVTRPGGVSVMAPSSGKWEYVDVASPFYGRPVRDVVGAGDSFRAGLAAFISAYIEEFRSQRLDYKAACLYASAVSYSYLSRDRDARPFSQADIRRLLAEC